MHRLANIRIQPLKPLKLSLLLLLVLGSPAVFAEDPLDNHINTDLLNLASQTDAAAFLGNPATVYIQSARHDYVINSAIGSYFNDKDELIDDFDAAEEEGERLEALSRERLLLPSDFERQIAIFERMDGKILTLSGGGTVAASLPIEAVETTLVASAVGRIATSFDYAEEDADRLRTAPILGVVAPPDLESKVIIHGIAISDIGLNFSHSFSRFDDLRLGFTLKYQGVRLLERAIEIDEYEDISLSEFRRGLDINHHINADLGVYKRWQNWHASLAIKSLRSKKFRGTNGLTYQQRPGAQLDLAYSADWGLAAINWDVVPSQRRFGLLEDEQRFRIGGQYQLNRRWHLSGGLQFVIEGRDSDAVTLGAGYTLGNGATINGALLYAGPREVGGAVQFRFPFWRNNDS